MKKIVAFEIKGKIGHFRRPDTTGAHLTYPIIPRTVVRGLIASILGQEQLQGEALTGIQLLSPVQTCTQEVSMLGKGWIGGGPAFNRPTSIELVVNPSYRVFYCGDFLEPLEEYLREGKSHYHTYMGSAYCLTFPNYVDTFDLEECFLPYPNQIRSKTVVPTNAIKELIIQKDICYGRIGAMHYSYLGDRSFSGTVNIIYEVAGKPILFRPLPFDKKGHPFHFYWYEGESMICLW